MLAARHRDVAEVLALRAVLVHVTLRRLSEELHGQEAAVRTLELHHRCHAPVTTAAVRYLLWLRDTRCSE